jgi:hypothetical protein
MFASLAQNVVLGWLFRRAQEIGGLVGTLALLYVGLGPQGQETISQLLGGSWQNVSLGAIATMAVYVWSQVQSFRATVKPQVVTTEGKKITPQPDSTAQAKIEAIAVTAPRKPTLLERIMPGRRT